MKTVRLLFMVVVVTLLVFTACSRDPKIKNIAVGPDTASGNRGQSIQFIAAVVGSNNPPQAVTWTVTGGTEGTTIGNADGELKIGKAETAETLEVIATSIFDPKKSGKAIVTVSDHFTRGPGGGIVFYDKGSISDGWRYLEAAPASSEFMATWGLNGVEFSATSTGIGTGKANTTAIINRLKTSGESGKAAQLCAALSINGFNDWFLPSKDELNEMYQKFRAGGINSSNWYWSSSVGDHTMYGAWSQRFSDGYQSSNYDDYYSNRGHQLSVRAVRAF